tara:strand:+ start:156615 stop:156791 length:177 start_codon:yes stop_codon:yes gene_type:complete
LQNNKAVVERSRTDKKRDGFLIMKLTLHKDLLVLVTQAVWWLSVKWLEGEIETIQGEE